MLTWQERQDLGPQLEDARAKLARFERGVLNRHVLERIRRTRPFHPFFLFRTLSVLAAMAFGVSALGVMVASMLDRDIAVFVSRLEEASLLPVPAGLALIALGGLLFALGAHLALLVVGRSAPLLPHEAREHQSLVSEVKRLEATMAVHSRLTPAGVDPRDIRPLP